MMGSVAVDEGLATLSPLPASRGRCSQHRNDIVVSRHQPPIDIWAIHNGTLVSPLPPDAHGIRLELIKRDF
jgi:hypothetical protein